nr:MAG TPA: hypothetical protein [Caudoviricetes sp.]
MCVSACDACDAYARIHIGKIENVTPQCYI